MALVTESCNGLHYLLGYTLSVARPTSTIDLDCSFRTANTEAQANLHRKHWCTSTEIITTLHRVKHTYTYNVDNRVAPVNHFLMDK